MWTLLVLTVVAALTTFYAALNERTFSEADNRNSMELAESMALYREAVILYYTANNLTNTSVSLATLITANMVPTWSTLYTSSTAPIWANYRDAGGIIYVYATSLPPVDILSEIAQLSQNSYLAGAYRQTGTLLYSPVYGDTGISLAALASKSVPDNAPVWVGMRR
jgi:hypothetical protein